MKKSIPFEFERQSMETEPTARSEFLNGRKTTEKQITASQEINNKDQEREIHSQRPE